MSKVVFSAKNRKAKKTWFTKIKDMSYAIRIYTEEDVKKKKKTNKK